MGQKFYASKRDTLACANGAIGFRTGGPFDCLGPFAKVKNCPIAGYPGVRLTAYASGYADTFFSVPANTRYRGRYVRGFFTMDETGIVFHPVDSHKFIFEKVPA